MAFLNSGSRLLAFLQRRTTRYVCRRPFLISSQRPLISFTFDDFPRSALTVGGAILNRLGKAGTYYASLGLVGKETASGQIFYPDDLTTLVEQGHELGCHTYSHCDSWETAADAFEDSIVQNRIALHRLFSDAEFKTFSYPISLPRPQTKRRIADYFLCSRGGGQTFNSGRVDLNQLSAYFLEKSRDDLQEVKDLIDRNRYARGWLILVTHDVSDNHTPFGCTPEFFETVVRYAINSGAQIVPVVEALEVLRVPGFETARSHRPRVPSRTSVTAKSARAKPLVSILIPAYNAQEWIADTLRSAMAQTWERKEIVVVDDGSSDQTLALAKQFESDCIRVVTQPNQGAASARNTALALSHGDYIQWLDADDLLAPDKIERQLAVLDQNVSKKTLLSSEFAKFLHRWQRAQFIPTGLWEDLSPTEWLLRKMGDNLFMQTATWLVSRELSELSGPWDTRMLSDDDGEYFCRVLLNSDGTKFVPDAKVYYRGFRSSSLAYVGKSDRKREALWLSMQLHIDYLRSLEDTARIREACLNYLQRNLINFYPERADIVSQTEQVAADLGGKLRPPQLSWKYSWIQSSLGWTAAKNVSLEMRKIRWSLENSLDRALCDIENLTGSFDDSGRIIRARVRKQIRSAR
jgi:glycosyltransferase involved in cell wall biosynthesis/peptidoglycan/xylan/chitin deacetylase (PgdA/CDA1 family)